MGKMISTEENLVGKVKGKALFNKNIRNNSIRGRDDRLYCRYLRYSEDITENQILRAALQKSFQFLNKYFGMTRSRENSYKEMIAYCHNALDHVSLKRITQRDTNSIKTTGCYAYYKPVISVAKMVLNEITLESNGTSKVTSYVVPYAVSMNKLFEMYVRAYLKKVGIQSCLSEASGIHILKYDYKSKVFENSSKDTANYIGGIVKPDIIIQNTVNGKTLVFGLSIRTLIMSGIQEVIDYSFWHTV
jgi:5-methylcytosine-specific restriction endonuclease McrBC regulatory subunit McrC